MIDSEKCSLEEARSFLASSRWLQEFPQDLRAEFLNRTRLLPPFERDERVFNIGDSADGIYGIVSGTFGFEIAPQEEGPYLTHQLRPGDWFGELAHVMRSPRHTTLYANGPGLCLRISAKELSQLLASDPRLWRYLATSLAHATLVAMTALNDLMLRAPAKRLAATLLRVAGLRNREPLIEADLDIDLTLAELALMTNISRSCVADNLRHFRERGFLVHRYGHIRLCDVNGLRQWLKDDADPFPTTPRTPR